MGEVCLFGKVSFCKKHSDKKKHFSKICDDISERKILHNVLFYFILFFQGVPLGFTQKVLITFKKNQKLSYKCKKETTLKKNMVTKRDDHQCYECKEVLPSFSEIYIFICFYLKSLALLCSLHNGQVKCWVFGFLNKN